MIDPLIHRPISSLQMDVADLQAKVKELIEVVNKLEEKKKKKDE